MINGARYQQIAIMCLALFGIVCCGQFLKEGNSPAPAARGVLEYLNLSDSFFLNQSDAGVVSEAGDQFGERLVAAGDVNGDGFEDMFVGAPGTGLGSGAVFGVFGGEAGATSGQFSITQADAGEVNEAGDQFGETLGSGDFNKDKIEDLIVGAPGKAPGGGPKSGAVYVFLGTISGLSPGFSITQTDAGEVNEAGDQFGAAVGSGDFNGDLIEDLVVGAPGKVPGGGPKSGAVYVFLGIGDGTFQPGFLLTQADAGEVNEAGDRFGAAMTVGDFNNDRIEDLVVGAPGKAPGGGPKSGVVYVFLGTKSGLNPGFSITQTDALGSADCVPTVPGSCVPGVNEEGDRFAEALGVGDLNGDAVEELIVGAPGEALSSGPRSGAVYIYPGSATVLRGLTTGYYITQRHAGGVNEAGDEFGAALSAGTLNDDAFEELAVGAPGKSLNTGTVYVFPGLKGNQIFLGETGSTRVGFLITQTDAGGLNEAGDRFGAAVNIEDFNDNLGAELVAGAPGAAPDFGPRSGAVFIFSGVPKSPPAITPVNACTKVDGVSLRPCEVNEAGDLFGTATVTGDFNDDGFADLAVGAPGKAPGQDPASGAAFIFPGSATPSGISTGFFITQTDAGGLNEAGDQFGAAVAAGDFNGDGFVDLAVGAPGKTSGGMPGSGAVFLFPGSINGLTCLLGYPCPTQIITGSFITQTDAGEVDEAGDQFGAAVAAGDFDGDGFEDLAVGTPGKVLGAANSGSVYVFYGSTAGITTGFQITQTDAGGANEAGDQFGAALAAEDIVGTAFADLIVGAPGQTIGGATRAGRVFIFPGSAGGFTAGLFIDQTDAVEANEAGDEFGAALIVGDFNDDRIRDLAVGAPGDAPAAVSPTKAGSVFVFRGSAAPGITAGPIQVITHADLTDPDEVIVTTPLAAGDRFGAALAIGRFNDDLNDDLIVGAPGKAPKVATDQKGGTVTVFPGSDGFTVADEVTLAEGISLGVFKSQKGSGGLAEAGDEFGAAMAVGDFNNDGFDDLAVGTPGEALGADPDSGSVSIVTYGDINFIIK